MKAINSTLAAALKAFTSTAALADAGHDSAKAFGTPGKEQNISRTITVRMGEMYFSPEEISVAPGETIRFVVINEGDAVHELNLGTSETWASHVDEMQHMVDSGMIEVDRVNHDLMQQSGMMHSDPNSVLLEPGDEAEIVWEFPGKAVEMGIACNVPGHRESGMVQQITFAGER